jgi:hypothetical protein
MTTTGFAGGCVFRYLDKLLFGGQWPLTISHHRTQKSTPMNQARYRSLGDKLLFSVPNNQPQL